MRYKLLINLSLLLTVFSLIGCEKHYRTYSKVKIISGNFHTPQGKFKIKILRPWGENNNTHEKRHEDNFFLTANDGEVSVKFATKPGLSSNKITHDIKLGKTLELKSLFYSMDDKMYAVNIFHPSIKSSGYLSDWIHYQTSIVAKRKSPITQESYRYFIEFPSTLKIRKREISKESYAKNNAQVHRFKLDFIVNEKSYVFDVKYKLLLIRESYYTTPYGGVSP